MENYKRKDLRLAIMAYFTEKAVSSYGETLSKIDLSEIKDNNKYSETIVERDCCKLAQEYYSRIVQQNKVTNRFYKAREIYDCFVEANEKASESIDERSGTSKHTRNAIVYCITMIVCAIIISLSIMQSGRYSTTMDGSSVVDKYKKVNQNVEYKWEDHN